jgi:putative chitinase
MRRPPVAARTSALVSSDKLSRFSPKAHAQYISAIIAKWSLADAASINTALRLDHFLAQIATETKGLTRLDEDLDYSAERLLQVFPHRVTPEQAGAVEHRPIEIANLVYDHVNGNVDPGDGWIYRGSGYLQLTGRGNFAARGARLHMALEQQPDLVRQAATGFAAATSYWQATDANSAAAADNLKQVRLLVNGGLNGMTDARIWLARAKHIFPPSPPEIAEEANAPSAAEIDAVKDRLAELGYLQRQPDESYSPTDFINALKRFQEENHLPVTGVYDDETLYSLTDPNVRALAK